MVDPSADPSPARPRRRRGAAAVADLLGEVLRPAARRRGFATLDLFTHWADIVGAAYAETTRPDRLAWPRRLEDGGEAGFEPATLTVRCEGSRALLFQHEAPQILERINAMFGFPAVARIRVVQRPIERPPSRRPPRLRALTRSEEAHVAGLVAEIEDDRLREALLRLGRAVVAAPKRP